MSVDKSGFKCRRELLDAIVIIHECTHIYTNNRLWKNNESYNSKNRIIKKLNSGKMPKNISFQLNYLIENHGLIDVSEAIAKSSELVFINKMYDENLISEAEKDTLLEFEKEFNSRMFDEGKAFYNVYDQVGEKCYTELLSNFDLLNMYRFKKKLQGESEQKEFEKFVNNPFNYMKENIIVKNRKDDLANVKELLELNKDSKKLTGFNVVLKDLVNNSNLEKQIVSEKNPQEKDLIKTFENR